MVEHRAQHHAFDFHNCVVIVAHPDDETLWCGGTILMHPESNWTVVTVCRRSDADRALRFAQAQEALNASGRMGDLDDGPEQSPLTLRDVENAIVSLLPGDRFDLVITHSLWGEYTRHLRHEETARAVMALRESGRLTARELRMFAYEDGDGKYLPRPARDADMTIKLPEDIWRKKYEIITGIYGFGPDTFEAKVTPKDEAFWVFGLGRKVK